MPYPDRNDSESHDAEVHSGDVSVGTDGDTTGGAFFPPDEPRTQSEQSLRFRAPTYRADIDGLRALAVIPVVLFHARVAGFGGGFVGVDVFFVISGFLITGLIKHEVDLSMFSYFSFWERRARRLLPPMILVIAVTYFVAYQILFPEELKALGQSIVAISVFASNIQFWRKAGYFAAPSEMLPLLHTWSLAVEEQFYFLFPAVLVGLSVASPMRRFGVVSAIGVASFALSVWWVNVSPNSAYFLLPARAWELMLGAGLALMPSAKTLSRLATNALLLTGLALIALSVCWYTAETPFPGIAALIPCAGTALIIWTGQQSHGAMKRLFDNVPMVFVGKLSYSIYLWHWPLLVLFAAWAHKPLKLLTTQEVVVIVAATMILSWLSLTLIENPIRRKRVCRTRSSIFFATGTAMAVLAAFGLGAHFFGGYPSRIPANVQLIADGGRDTYSSDCFDKSPAAVDAGGLCRIGGRDGKYRQPRFMLWGDSHADALLPVVDAVAKEFGVTGLHASKGSCPPLPDLDVSATWAIDCRAFNDSVLRQIDRADLDAVFLAAFWTSYEVEGSLRYADGRDGKGSSAMILELQLRALIARLRARGIAVFVFEEAPWPEHYYPARFAQAVWQGADPGSAGISVRDYQNRNEHFASCLNNLRDLDLHRISPLPDFCSDGSFCPAVTEGRSNFRDEVHLSVHGAGRLAPAFRDAFARVNWTASGGSEK